MFKKLVSFMQRPSLFEKSTAKFWDDPHISQGMLDAHLSENLNAATRNLAFVKTSVDWIAKMAPPSVYSSLLDLGCGPGIYAELFCKKGYHVTGIDFSPRSIEYAIESSKKRGLKIRYSLQNYLHLCLEEKFDVVTLIYCDYGVLSPQDRKCLLQNISSIIKPDGLLILDVFTPHQYKDVTESRFWEYSAGGFYSAEPYICLHTTYEYENHRTFCNQHIVATKDEVKCYNIWEHTFTTTDLSKELLDAGFHVENFYGNIGGACYEITSKELCVIARR